MIRKELAKYSPDLAARPEIVALSKADLTDVKEAYPTLKKRFKRAKIDLRLVSAATREGLADLVAELFAKVQEGKRQRIATPDS